MTRLRILDDRRRQLAEVTLDGGVTFVWWAGAPCAELSALIDRASLDANEACSVGHLLESYARRRPRWTVERMP